MDHTETDPVICQLRVPLWRRLVGVLVLGSLTAALAGLAWSEPAATRRLGLGLAALAGGLVAAALWRGSGGAVLLRASGRIETGGGQSLALPGEIASVETGTLALRPSNGILLRLRAGATPGWAPGLWWRFGRRLGIGGLAAAAEVKTMAAALNASRHRSGSDR